jgi:DegV family protein with EDD domain
MFPAGAVTVVESHWVSLALAFQVRAAAVAVGEGGTVQDAVLAVQALEGRLGLFFLLETLDNLRKGGRISAGAALVGGLLHVKPILQMQQGRIGLVARARSMQSGVRRLVGMVASQLPGSAPVHVGLLHARAPARMAELEREVRQRLQVVEVLQAEVGPAIGVHVGEGAVGLAFYTE